MRHQDFKRNPHQSNKLMAFSIPKIVLLMLMMISVYCQQVELNNEHMPRRLEDDDIDESANQIIEGADVQFDDPPSKPSNVDKSTESIVNKKVDRKALEEVKKNARTRFNVNKQNLNDFELEDLKARYKRGEYALQILSIMPKGGPITGRTRVLVRFDNLAPFVDVYPKPKCKFGGNSMIVDAAYVKCSKKEMGFYALEKQGQTLDSVCVQCENSPIKDVAEVISFTVSLTGDFDDASSSMPYRYYNKLKVLAINPRYGPKDGDTVVEVWGENFLDLGDDFRCNFGTQSTKAHFINPGYLWCRAPKSDVVERAMPFSVSLNRQQNSLEKHEYWFYNMQSLFKVEPDYGSMTGDQKITLRGQNFKPWEWNEIDNQNETFCAFGPLGKTPAQVISQTEAECLTPANYMKLTTVPIKITLNNQNYTDEEKFFTFFNPPNVVDVGPLIGPVKGGTVVNFWGSSFERKNITCTFGHVNVTGKFVSKSQIQCESPPYKEPGTVKLKISYQNDRFTSDTFNFKYYADPLITSAPNACGPVEGYTQFTIYGKNFEEFGFGKAKCIFNNTHRMNATIVDKSTIVCDSPPLDSMNGDMWYNLSVTLDGVVQSNFTDAKFKYYNQPKIYSISPSIGPMEGGTNSLIRGQGFNQTNLCQFVVRYGCMIIPHTLINDTAINVTSFPANMTGSIVASVSGNNQQFIDDITIHFRDKENTFEYFQPFYIEWLKPDVVSNAGNSPILIRSIHFDQFKFDNGTVKDVPIKCRFVQDTEEGQLIGNEMVMEKLDNQQQICYAPKTDFNGDAKIELSANGQQWQKTTQKVKFYNGPKVTSVNPTYGVTKNPKNQKITISGENFDCPGNDCNNIKVRFTNDKGDQIFQDGKKVGQNIETLIPKYPAPETLKVDISMNGQDYTNDNVKYGFIDPYVLSVSPRLYTPKSSSTATLRGYGFVQMDDSQSQVSFMSKGQQMMCPGADESSPVKCTAVYKVLNENTIQVQVPDQKTVKVNGKQFDQKDSFEIYVMNVDGEFEQNGIELYYYNEFQFKNISSSFAYSNEEKPVMIETDFKWNEGNNYAIYKKVANLTCRFTGQSEQPVKFVTPAYMETQPIGGYLAQQLPNQIRCRTPKWNNTEVTTLEISPNGQDYIGNFPITFVENLRAVRISPMAGPIGGSTKVKFYGYGYTSSIPKQKDVFVRFGTADSQILDKSSVTEQDKWNSDNYYTELKIPKGLLKFTEINDQKIEDETGLRTYLGAATPDISTIFSRGNPDYKFMGGPIYVQLSEKVPIQATVHQSTTQSSSSIQSKKRMLASSANTYTDLIETTYPDSSNLEFFFYRQPFIKKVEPSSGLATGGTPINITGGWFQYEPKYGVMPFCKIGDTVIRATYVQSNRIQCKTPPSIDTTTPSPISVSLNGVDFKDTNFTFSYYEKPILSDIQPRSGKSEGGTEIWLKGQKFSRISSGMKQVRCRFRQVVNETLDDIDEDNVPTKFMPAFWVDKETMKCASPAGFNSGARVKVDLTFNGADYTEQNFDFYMYQIFQSFPKSGPADATNQFIQIKGAGFRDQFTIVCQLNEVDMSPVKVKQNVILCPMHPPNWPAEKYETVPFTVSIDGVKKDLGNFHYYKQIEIESVSPLLGPNEGKGSIFFTGKNFRNDFENAKLGCRIGNSLAKAQLEDSETIKCTIQKKIPLVDEGVTLPVSIALNSYSWAPSEFSYKPYGILDLYPTSGPVNDNTNVNVVGKGFANDLQDNARCRFGTEGNYQIVEAQVLDDEHLICKSPSDSMSLPENASPEISIPFGIAFQDDIYNPFTEGIQKFRMYNQPLTVGVDPAESPVQKLTEVYIYADAEDEQGFKQPIPSAGKNSIQQDQYGPKCKFGRFGNSPATYINATTMICLTPTISEDPSDISEEQVTVSVAMNGVDFNDDISRAMFTFTGTGGGISTWVIIMGTLIFGLLIVSVLIFVSGVQAWWKTGRDGDPGPYTEQNQLGRLQPRSMSRGGSAQQNQLLQSNVAAENRISAMRSRMQNSRMQQSRGSNFGSQARMYDNRFQNQPNFI